MFLAGDAMQLIRPAIIDNLTGLGTGKLITGNAPGIYPSTASLAIIGASVILMLIPVGVGLFTLRKTDNGQ